MDPIDIQLIQRGSSLGTEEANPTQRTSKAIDDQYFIPLEAGGIVSSISQSDNEESSKIERYSKAHKNLKSSSSLPRKDAQAGQNN